MNVRRELSPNRLAGLLLDLREDLDLEVKNWLDLDGDNLDRATFAKAALALANHGGGFIVLGFEDRPEGLIEAHNRPDSMARYSQDLVNGIVERYCEPAFHCTVHLVENRTGSVFPVVNGPGGHRVPVRARRSGPEEKVLRQNDIYVRRPGPKSEVPRTSQEWDELLARCFENRRDELVSVVRHMLAGVDPRPEPERAEARLDHWVGECFQRWSELVDDLPLEVGPRFRHGYYSFAYEVVDGGGSTTLAELPEILKASIVRHTGWPPFWYPTRKEIAPYPFDGAVECWLGGDAATGLTGTSPDPAHADFWRIAPSGLAYLLRGYVEDGARENQAGERIRPGTGFDVTLPVWRAGEALLQAAQFSRTLLGRPTTIRFMALYTGLAGRSLVSWANPRRWSGREYACRDGSIRRVVEVESEAISVNLPEIIHQLLAPLFELFGFFRLSKQLVTEELEQMRLGRF